MTILEQRSLATVPLTKEYIESIWSDRNTAHVEDLQTFVRQLCLSHERLRMELEGLEVMDCPHCGPHCDLKESKQA